MTTANHLHIRIASETVISETDLECQKQGHNAF